MHHSDFKNIPNALQPRIHKMAKERHIEHALTNRHMFYSTMVWKALKQFSAQFIHLYVKNEVHTCKTQV